MTANHPVFAALPGDWDIVTIGDIATKVGSGATPRGGKRAYLDDGAALIRSQNVLDLEFTTDGLARITDEAAHKLRNVEVQENDVLINITGASIARCTTAPAAALPARVNQHVAIIRLGSRGYQPFLKYVLNHPRMKEYILSHNAGASREAITKAHIESFLVPLPPLREQQAIAEILSSLDERIGWCAGLQRKIRTTLTALFRTLPKPTGSPVAVADIAKTVNGRSYKSSELSDTGPDGLVNLKNIPRGGGYTPAGVKGYCGGFKMEQRLSHGDLVIACTDLTQGAEVVARVGRVEDDGTFNHLVASLDLVIVRPKAESWITPSYLHEVLADERFAAHGRAHTNGTTVLHMKKAAVPGYEFPPHGAAEIDAFTHTADEMWARYDEAARERRTLEEQRGLLLSRLVSGELRVSDVEAVLPEGA